MLNILGSMSTPGFAVGSEVQPLNYSQITQAINSDILSDPEVNVDLIFQSKMEKWILRYILYYPLAFLETITI